MTAHLHDGVLQTLALIQLHADDEQQVFTLARSQERELRSWLYQERTTSDRSVSAGLQEIAAQVEDTHGKPIEVVTVGDARPSAQTDALLDAARQAMVNAVTHGGEPVSVYCEADRHQVEVFVRDHGNGFDIDDIPPERLGIRESIIGRVRRRGGTVEIVSRPDWGTEVRMHMPLEAGFDSSRTSDSPPTVPPNRAIPYDLPNPPNPPNPPNLRKKRQKPPRRCPKLRKLEPASAGLPHLCVKRDRFGTQMSHITQVEPPDYAGRAANHIDGADHTSGAQTGG